MPKSTSPVLLPDRWIEYLRSQPETGMGFQIATIELVDGRKFEQVAIVGGYITKIRGRDDIPFSGVDVVKIRVTHQKWNFNEERQ